MNNQVKVKIVQPFKDSQKGECLVAKGKLMLIKDTERKDCTGLIRCIKDWRSYIDINKVGDIKIGKNTSIGVFEYWEPIKPIIFSEELIEVGDQFINIDNPVISDPVVPRHIPYLTARDLAFKKILALPENFSPKHLQAIVDGMMKDGDSVMVECEEYHGLNTSLTEISSYNDNPIEYGKDFKIKLNSNNHITLHKVEKSWDDIFKSLPYPVNLDYISEDNMQPCLKWLKENYEVPKRK